MNYLNFEIWRNLKTGEFDACQNKNNYGACYEDWELVARKSFLFQINEGLEEHEKLNVQENTDG